MGVLVVLDVRSASPAMVTAATTARMRANLSRRGYMIARHVIATVVLVAIGTGIRSVIVKDTIVTWRHPMSDALDTIRELLNRQAAPCTGPVCAGEEYHMCDFGGDWSDFGQCCDSCDMAQAAAGGLRIIYDKHFEGLLAALVVEEVAGHHFAKCSYELGGCETASEDDGLAIFCDTYSELVSEAAVRRTEALATIAADAKVALTACAKPGEEHS